MDEYIDTVNSLVSDAINGISISKYTTADVKVNLPSALTNQCIRDAKSIVKKYNKLNAKLAKQGKDKQATELIIAIIRFDMTGEEPTITDDGVAFVWESVIRPQLEENIHWNIVKNTIKER